MKRSGLLDTGPLVAFLNRRDPFHAWALEAWSRVPVPLVTSEPVLTEASFLLKRSVGTAEHILELLERGTVRVGISAAPEARVLRRLMAKYSDLPMSLADATLVRLSELVNEAWVLTLDRDFLVYRRHGRKTIPLIAPW